MGRPTLSRNTQGRVPEESSGEEYEQMNEGNTGKSQSLPRRNKHLTPTEWVRVFGFMDANPALCRNQVVAHFKRIGLRVTRQTLVRKVEARKDIERLAAAEAGAGKSDETVLAVTRRQGHIPEKRPKGPARASRSKGATVSAAPQSAQSSKVAHTSSEPSETPSPSIRRSSRVPVPLNQAKLDSSSRVRRSTRRENVPRRCLVDPSSSEPSSSSSSSESSEEDEDGDNGSDDDDFDAEVDEGAPTASRQPLSGTRPRTRLAETQAQMAKAISCTSARTELPFVLVPNKPSRRQSPVTPVPPPNRQYNPDLSHIDGPGAPSSRSICEASSGNTVCKSAVSKDHARRSPPPRREKDPTNLTPDLEAKPPSCTRSVPEEHATSEKSPSDSEYGTLAPRLKRKRIFYRVAPLHEAHETLAHCGGEAKRPRLAPPLPVPPSSSPPLSSSPSVSSLPLTTPPAASTPPRASRVFPPLSPYLALPPEDVEREKQPVLDPRPPTEPSHAQLISIAPTPDTPTSLRVLSKSDLEQHGFQSRLWDAWVP